ncbi:hypothetical protein NDU88_005724 [Pleurodeles waltl]|uniref:Uncharacterized protein n=1 Tax=Pleurodeles waltl TaxID=8319 RepID=A0AAV7L5N6_PLEWA|nr:hypothetical protein NDU88_005724 [Pleurodeles waltl]
MLDVVTSDVTLLWADLKMTSDKVKKRRHSFEEVKELSSCDLKYMLLYQATLRMIAEGETWHFQSPEETWEWLEDWRSVGRRTGRGTRDNRKCSPTDKEITN